MWQAIFKYFLDMYSFFSPNKPITNLQHEHWSILYTVEEKTKIQGGFYVDPRMKEQIKPRRVLEYKNSKTRPYCPSLPHVVTINGTV